MLLRFLADLFCGRSLSKNSGLSLSDLYASHQGKVSDKWSIYLQEYDRLFFVYRECPIRLLEIGVQNGGSLDIWSRYFSNAEKIVGCDINPACSLLEYDDARIAVIVGNANTDSIQESVMQHSNEFDIIIDDGSHLSEDIVKSFFRYFPNLTDGGIYVVEDLHCSYWHGFQGGLYYPLSSISLFKLLADVVNHQHWGVDKSPIQLFAEFSTTYGVKIDNDLLKQVHSVEFINSICIVRKLASINNELGLRIIAGDMEKVADGMQRLNNTQCPTLHHQMNNPWSTLAASPFEAIDQTHEALALRETEISNLKHHIIELNTEIARLKQK